jgi:hypothetical protein
MAIKRAFGGLLSMGMRDIERELAKRSFCGVLLFYSPTELAKMTQSSLSNVSNEVKTMVERGILVENAILPWKKTYRLNREYFNKHYACNINGKIEPVTKLKNGRRENSEAS